MYNVTNKFEFQYQYLFKLQFEINNMAAQLVLVFIWIIRYIEVKWLLWSSLKYRDTKYSNNSKTKSTCENLYSNHTLFITLRSTFDLQNKFYRDGSIHGNNLIIKIKHTCTWMYYANYIKIWKICIATISNKNEVQCILQKYITPTEWDKFCSSSISIKTLWCCFSVMYIQ